jgi:hypothetical protein
MNMKNGVLGIGKKYGVYENVYTLYNRNNYNKL